MCKPRTNSSAVAMAYFVHECPACGRTDILTDACTCAKKQSALYRLSAGVHAGDVLRDVADYIHCRCPLAVCPRGTVISMCTVERSLRRAAVRRVQRAVPSLRGVLKELGGLVCEGNPLRSPEQIAEKEIRDASFFASAVDSFRAAVTSVSDVAGNVCEWDDDCVTGKVGQAGRACRLLLHGSQYKDGHLNRTDRFFFTKFFLSNGLSEELLWSVLDANRLLHGGGKLKARVEDVRGITARYFEKKGGGHKSVWHVYSMELRRVVGPQRLTCEQEQRWWTGAWRRRPKESNMASAPEVKQREKPELRPGATAAVPPVDPRLRPQPRLRTAGRKRKRSDSRGEQAHVVRVSGPSQ